MAKEGFISWSGEEARKVAEHLQQFLKYVLANPPLFVASKDIKAGSSWFSVISEKLDLCDVGIIIVTPQNKERPWLHFEAGAIAKRVGSGAAIPLLCGVAKGELGGTALAQLQALEMNDADLRQLCARLNELLDLNLEPNHIDETFAMWWAKYESLLIDPGLWGAPHLTSGEPTIADVSVQLDQISASLAQLTDFTRRSIDRVAPAIQGQGQLATMSLSDVRAALFPTAPNVSLDAAVAVLGGEPWADRLKKISHAAEAASASTPPSQSAAATSAVSASPVAATSTGGKHDD